MKRLTQLPQLAARTVRAARARTKRWLDGRTEDIGCERGEPDSEPEPFVDKAPPDRFCDLVLTGGVTSGVIYPSVAVELARHYRFKNIAGTSAGAMAAALTAAAEYARRKGLLPNRFEALSDVPKRLAEDVNGKTRLLSLFQPSPKTKRLFGLFLGMLNRSEAGSGMTWSGMLAWTLVKQYWFALVLPLLLGLALAYAITPRWLAMMVGFCAFVTAGVICVAHRVYRDLNDGMVSNGFGMCKGSETTETTDPDNPPLIDWLHKRIQELAGKPENEPLTFKDLWDAEALPPWLIDLVPPDKRRAIDLQIITANLTHGRPYRLPLDDDSTRLFFKESEWRTYFPAGVMTHLLRDDVSPRYAPRDSSEPPVGPDTEDLRELPKGKLPIVVAARLSLSFPFLFSAVPLWAIDFEPKIEDHKTHRRKLRRCWFSDGGICSNFPIHLFDAFLPKWPTFGISLGRRSPFRPYERTWLPDFHNEGSADAWNRFDDETSLATGKPRTSLQRLVGFAMSIIATAKDWNDNTEMRMPGYRDRVVRVGFCDGEGELNVRLVDEEIVRLARDYGTAAGKKLVNRFISRDPDCPSQAWRDHRWVRFNVLLQSLRERVNMIELAAQKTPHTQPLKQQIAKAFAARALRGDQDDEAPLSAAQADALDGLLDAVIELERQFDKYAAQQPYKAEPKPSLRNRPP